LKGSIDTTILLKNNISTLMNPIAASLIEAKDPNTFSLTIINATNVIVVEFGVKA
jgi:hypothetical protein